MVELTGRAPQAVPPNIKMTGQAQEEEEEGEDEEEKELPEGAGAGRASSLRRASALPAFRFMSGWYPALDSDSFVLVFFSIIKLFLLCKGGLGKWGSAVCLLLVQLQHIRFRF